MARPISWMYSQPGVAMVESGQNTMPERTLRPRFESSSWCEKLANAKIIYFQSVTYGAVRAKATPEKAEP